VKGDVVELQGQEATGDRSRVGVAAADRLAERRSAGPASA
jgi:hypothetical protein